MADDIKSLAARIQKLENIEKGRGPTIAELERQSKYLNGILDTQNKLLDRVEALEQKVGKK